MRSDKFEYIEQKLSAFWWSRRGNFIGRGQFIRELEETVQHENSATDKNIILVEGAPGAGKSAVASVLQGNEAIPRLISYAFSVSHPDINNFGSFSEYVCGCLQRNFNIPDVQALDPLDKLQSSLVAAANSPVAEENGHIYILLDGIEEFPEYFQLLKRLPRKEEIVYLLFAQPNVVKIEDAARLQLPALDKNEAIKILENCFGDGWAAAKPVAYKLLEHEENLNPLILTEFAKDFVPGTKVSGDWWEQIRGLRSYFEKRTEDFDETTRGVLGALAYSYEPLSKPTLEEFAHVDAPVLERCLSLATRFVELKDGAYEYRHNAWRTYAHEIYEKGSGERFAMWSGENAYSETTNDLGYCLRWGARHLIDFEKWDKASKLLSDLNYLMRRVKTPSLNALFEEYAQVAREAQNKEFEDWRGFIQEKGYMLWRGSKDWGPDKILFQLAWEDGADSAVSLAADKYLKANKVSWNWLHTSRNDHKRRRNCLTMAPAKNAIELEDGRILSWDKTEPIQIWDAITGKCLVTFEKASSNVGGVIELNDGRLASWGENGDWCLWNLATGKCTKRTVWKDFLVWNAIKLKDNKVLLRGKKGFGVWDDSITKEFSPVSEDISGAIQLRDGRILTWSADNPPRLWKIKTEQSRRDKEITYLFATCQGELKFDREDVKLEDSWDLTDDGDQEMDIIPEIYGAVQFAVELKDGNILTLLGENGHRIFDPNTGVCIDGGEDLGEKEVLVLRDGRLLILPSNGAMMRSHPSIKTNIGDEKEIELSQESDCEGAIQLKNGDVLAWYQDASMCAWNSATGALRARYPGHPEHRINSLTELRDGRILTSGGDNTLRIWDFSATNAFTTAGNYCDGAIELNSGRILSWADQDDGWHGGGKSSPCVRDNKTGQVLLALEPGDRFNKVVELSNSRVLGLGATPFSSNATIWDITTGKVVVRLKECFPDGAIELNDGRILGWGIGEWGIWDASTGDRIEKHEVTHEDAVIKILKFLKLKNGNILAMGIKWRVLSPTTEKCLAEYSAPNVDLTFWEPVEVADGLIALHSLEKPYYVGTNYIWDVETGALTKVDNNPLQVRLNSGEILDWDDRILRVLGTGGKVYSAWVSESKMAQLISRRRDFPLWYLIGNELIQFNLTRANTLERVNAR